MSGIFKLNSKDLLKGLIVVALSALFYGLIQVLPSISFLQNPLAQTLLSTILGYLAKNLATDEQGKVLGKI